MRITVVILTVLLIVSSAFTGRAEGIRRSEIDYQNRNFQKWWGTTLSWMYDRLPTRGSVPHERLPYSGCIYPDSNGGTEQVLAKYDRAFHQGRPLAVQFERRDIDEHQTVEAYRFRGRTRYASGTPYWAGHCNGWTAAAIRHAEPQRPVRRNGVVFSPADIKGLLAELYVYADAEFLGGESAVLNPGLLHVIVANWIGVGRHPVGMEATPGREVWNYPVIAFSSSSRRRDARTVEVRLVLRYANFIERDVDRAPRRLNDREFHYWLDLNTDGEIVGGGYIDDSPRIDMLWVPLQPTQGGKAGNQKGNPFLDMETVLGMWREATPFAARENWWNINPMPLDALDSGEAEKPVVAPPSPPPYRRNSNATSGESQDQIYRRLYRTFRRNERR